MPVTLNLFPDEEKKEILFGDSFWWECAQEINKKKPHLNVVKLFHKRASRISPTVYRVTINRLPNGMNAFCEHKKFRSKINILLYCLQHKRLTTQAIEMISKHHPFFFHFEYQFSHGYVEA